MSKRAITPELFNDLIRAFRLQPGVYSAAARVSGVTHKTAKKAWLEGWPNKGFKPIKDQMEAERSQVRAHVALAEGEEAMAVRKEILEEMERGIDGHLEGEASKVYAMEVKMEEARMLGGIRGLITSNVDSLRALAGASEGLATKLAQSIRTHVDSEEELVFGTVEYNRAQRAFRGVAMAARDISTAVKTTIEAERLHIGEPTEIVGHKDLDAMTIEELMEEIAQADESITAGERRGLIAIEGGKSSPPTT
jgi:hypothetical protein